MVTREVELRIRASDRASKSLAEIATALDELKTAQQGLSSGSKETAQFLDKLTASYSKLQKEIGDLAELEKTTKELEVLNGALRKNEKSLADSQVKLQAYNQQFNQVSTQVNNYRQQLESLDVEIRKQSDIVKASKNNQSGLVKEIEKAKAAYDVLRGKVSESKNKNEELNQSLLRQREILKQLREEKKQNQTSSSREIEDLKKLNTARIQLNRNLREPSTTQNKTEEAIRKVSESLDRQRSSYSQLNEKIANADTRSRQLAASLGLSEVSLESLSSASQKAISQLQKLNNVSRGKIAVSSPVNDLSINPNLSKYLQDLKKANNELKTAFDNVENLQKSLNESDKPSDQIVRNLERANAVLKTLRSSFAATFNTQSRNGALDAQRMQVEAIRDALKKAREEATALGAANARSPIVSPELTTQFEQARQRVRSLNQEYVNQSSILTQLGNSIRQSSQSFRVLTPAAQGSQNSFASLLDSIRSLLPNLSNLRGVFQRFREVAVGSGAALVSVVSNSNAAGTALRALRGQVLGVTTAYLGFFAIADQFQKVIQAIRTLEAAQSRLSVVFNGNQDLGGKELAFVRREAERLAQDFGILATQYSKFAVSAKGANIATDVTRKLFTATAEAARVNKLSNEELERTFTALSQILNKGKFQAEEVTQQLGEVIPGAANILASALTKVRGELVTTGDLFKEFQNGTVIADENTLLAFAEELSSRFSTQVPNALDTTTAKLDQFNSNLKNVRLNLAQGPFDSALSDFLDKLNSQLTSSQAQQFFSQLGSAAAETIKVFSFLSSNISELITLLLAYKIAGSSAFFTVSKAAVQLLPVMISLSLAFSKFIVGLRVTSVIAFVKSLTAMRIGFSATTIASLTAATSLRGFAAALIALRVSGGPFVKLLELVVSGLVALGLALGIEELISYATSVDDASAANSRYEQTLRDVLKAADESGGNIQALRERVKDLSEVEIGLDLSDYEKKVEESKEKIAELISSVEDLRPVTQAVLGDLVTLFNSGAISAQQFIEALNSQKQADPGLDVVAAELRDTIRQSELASGKVRNLEDILRVLTGTTKDAKSALASLNGEIQHSSSNAQKSAKNIQEYQKAYETLVSKTKEGKKDLEKLEIEQVFQQGSLALASNNVLVRTPQEIKKNIQEYENLKKARDAALAELNPRETKSSGGSGGKNPQAEFNKKLLEESLDRQFQINQAVVEEGELKTVAEAKYRAVSEAQRQGLVLSKEQLAVIEKEAGLLFDTQARFKIDQKLEEDSLDRQRQIFQLNIEDERVRTISEATYKAIVESQKVGLELSKQQLDLIEKETGALYDIQNRRKGFEDAEKKVNDLLEARRLIQQRIETLRNVGDATSTQAADELEGRLKGIEEQARLATDKAIELAKALGDTNAVLNLENIKLSLGDLGKRVAITASQINESLAQGGIKLFDDFFQSVSEGIGVFQSLGNAVRQFFADFLKQIAQAILQQAILNALRASGANNSGGIGAIIQEAVGSLFHEGGIVGRDRVPTRRVNSEIWNRAKKYHSGGVAGLQPNEVPAILKRNEEVLTTSDPRHRFNGGSKMPDIKVINTIDSGSFVSQGLASKQGSQSLLNFIRANNSQIKGILGT